MATPQNPVELWQIYVEGLQKLGQWEELLRQSLENTSKAVVGDHSALLELTLSKMAHSISSFKDASLFEQATCKASAH